MKSSCAVPVSRSTFLALTLMATAILALGEPPVLRWNGPSGGLWDAATANWLDAGDNAVAWQPGATAAFAGGGGIVNVAADVAVSNIAFTGSGYALLGAGRLAVEGGISAAAATTNSVAADILTLAGLSKIGAGALALARCTGPFAVAEGTLLVSGSLFADADLSVASGASLVTLGDPDAASNLILNPGFELPALGNGGHAYVGGANVISNWTVASFAAGVARQNTATASAWNAAGASPDGTHMLILQYNGTVAQTVTVPVDGLYSVAFSHLMRNVNLEHQVYVTLDGVPLATFLNRSVQFAPGRFASAALWLTAGSHTLGIGGEGGWGDRSTMVDTVCFAPPSSANACRALAGDSVLRAVTGASVLLNHGGTVPLAYVALNGAPASGTINASHASGVFAGSGALSCASPANVFAWSGSGLWSEAARWVDGAAPAAGGSANLLLRFPSAAGGTSQNDLADTFLARRLAFAGVPAGSTFALTGNAIALTNDASGTFPKLSLAALGSVTVSAPVTSRSALTLDTLGTLTFEGSAVGVASNSILYKSGTGSVTTPTLGNFPAAANIYEGTLRTPALPSGLTANMLTQVGKAAALVLTQAQTAANRINIMGAGTATLAVACGGGGEVRLTDWMTGYGDNVVFDVGAGDTLSLRQMLLVNLSSGAKISATTLLKTGAGTLEIRSGGADTAGSRAYQGPTTLRNGTLILSEDDWGTLSGWSNPFNNRTYSATGGSLGYSAFTNRLRICDSGTAAEDALQFVANGAGRWIGRDIEVFDKGSAVTFGMTTGTVMYAGTVTLHRDIALSGPADGVMVFSNIVAAADFSGTGALPLSGLAGLRVEGSLPASAALAMNGRSLRFGTYAVRAQTLSALTLGSSGTPGTLDVDFGAGANDIIAVTAADGLTLSETVVNLACAGTGLPYAEPGTYTLFTYAGTLGGDAALLSVGNPQSGAAYAFSNDEANGRVLLTISNTSGGSAAIWKSATGGAWATGSNWDSGTSPAGAGVIPLFGLAATSPATVTLDTGYTVGGLVFNNAFNGYTLSGGALTLDDNGAKPSITVNAGTHVLDTVVNGAAGLSVAAASNTALILGTNAAVNTSFSLDSGTVELRGNAAVSGATDLGASTLLRAAATNAAVGSLSGTVSSTLELAGTAAKLTVDQAAPGMFAGKLQGDTGTLVKQGASALTLNNPGSVYAGRTEVAAGALTLQGVPLPGALSVGPAGTLDVQAAPTNGLMGHYYSVTPNTNNFWTLAAMEAHFATLKPSFAVPSGLAGQNFDFATSGTLFPQPYGAGGSRMANFEVAYRGVITVPESGSYVFGLNGDDGFILAIDGKTVVARNRYVAGWTDSVIRLDAGRYDIVIGYFQLTGGYGLQVRVRAPSAPAAIMLPNAWLTPYSSVGALAGDGSLALAASNTALRVVQSTATVFTGDLAGAAGSLLAKSGNGTLAFGHGGANAFAGDVDVQGGVLALVASECVGEASTLRVRSGATLAVAGVETVGALAGAGTVAVGGYVYANAFTDETDCDISTSKTYTHLIDFPVGTYAPVINGVTFGNTGAWSGGPVGVWNNAPADTTRTGIDSLLWDFTYGSTDFTLTLSGLIPGKAYETRLYFRNFNNNNRNLVFTFMAGATPVSGSIPFNPDTGTRSIVGCRYTADAAGTLSVRVVSLSSTDTCHLYGLSNEEATGETASTLTLAPVAGRSSRFSGGLAGSGALIKQGAGTQAFSGANTLPSPLDVQDGAVTLESGATVAAGVAVAAGALLDVPLGGVTLGGLSGQGLFSLGAYPTNVGPYFVSFTNDAGTGISASKTYTHLLDFGTGGAKAIVNGVAFDKISATFGAINGYGWTNIPSSSHGGGNGASIGIPTSQSISNLLYDFNYNARTTAVQLTGLTIGKRYEVRFYHRRWEAGEKNRTQTFIFDPDGIGPASESVTFNPDSALVRPNNNYLGYRYVAYTNFLTVTIQAHTGDTYHLYGLSNEEGYDTIASPVTLDIAGSSVFDGAVTGQGGLAKTGAGALTITGASTSTGPVFVNAGAFGAAGGGCATRGPVAVAAGATLFGDGLVGGDVTIASNAWLQAGTAAACGTLQVGGNLALAQGARIAWRFGASAADAFTVNGLLTFPASGAVQASALGAGLPHAPAKAVLFASTQTINGPADLTGWTVEGVENCSLAYNGDRTVIYVRSPRGTLLQVR